MKPKIQLAICVLACALQGAAEGPFISIAAKGSPDHPRNSDGDIIELTDGSILNVWCDWASAASLPKDLDQRLATRPGGAIGHDLSPCNIVGSISRDEGRTWGPPKVIIKNDQGDLNVMPVNLLWLDNGELMLHYHRNHSGSSTSSFVQFSKDNAKTWSAPVRVWGPTKDEHLFSANGILRQLSSGRIVLPFCFPKGELFGENPQKARYASTYWSDDRGRTWHRSKAALELPMRGTMEPTVAERPDGSLLMVMRTQLGSIFVSESKDGIEWTPPQTSGIIAPESRPCIARIPGTKEMVLVWNAALYQPQIHHFGVRTPLSAAISRDGGKTWGPRKDIESDPTYEYTNMAVAFTRKGKMLIHYMASQMEPSGRFGRTAIDARVAVVPLDWLRKP